MIDEKNWYRSKTIWGALLTIAATLSSSLGFSLDENSQMEISEAILQAITAAGALTSIYGRLTARDIIR